ncbi:photosystem I reaction center subunit PsaK [Candidatus Synechococcus spongiarum LMB bulk15M]|uniref:Photosystem I reaction center subunit PsaK n=1 Tax=Candidatus Synechococcus spongiarum LMB bulk15M TaxID=1943582 RepID=A0A1T1CN76_9SYNE|nr:photosystem I reaction center subunit PsaK [Candidatus Synechococcus spongiarum LMB bulk15M]
MSQHLVPTICWRTRILIESLFALTPATVTWTPAVGMVMLACNVVAIAIGKATIQKPDVGPAMPSDARFFGGFGAGAVLGTASLGHVLGIGAIQGLAAQGLL